MKDALALWASSNFEEGVSYSEREVNEVLASLMDDYVWLRRLMIDSGYLVRDAKGSQYRKVQVED
ncbi:DUF2087 domain-containing protein [Olsenella sp. KGMB02461]|nr:DUF2087 domain-containing protein [Olsenella sp. KGMB02461]